MICAINIHCTPPDIEPALARLLERTCKRIQKIDCLEQTEFGIQLTADNSPHKLGDTIWADVQLRGKGTRDIEWRTVNKLNNTVFSILKELAVNHVNKPKRLENPELAACEFIECNTTVQGVGHWAQKELKL